MESPFNKSSKTIRSPPATPTPEPEAPAVEDEPKYVSDTSRIQSWMSAIEQHLNEICTISTEGKLNSDQKLRIHKLCRSVAHGTSQMAVQYQGVTKEDMLSKAKIQALNEQLKALNEKVHISDSLQEIKSTIKDTVPIPNTSTKSFADIVKNSNSNALAIFPKDKSTSSEETKTLVQKIICPDQMKLHVTGLRKTKNGGVIISTQSKDDVEKLKKSAVLTTSGLTAEEPTKRKPRVIILGVPSTTSEKELYEYLYEQNIAHKLPNANREDVLSSIKLSHKSGRKDAPTTNFVLEVSPAIRKILMAQEKVFLNWSSHPIRDFTMVTRCFKCQQYGHAAKSCREETSTCGHCGEAGHKMTDCKNKSGTPKCASCLRYLPRLE